MSCPDKPQPCAYDDLYCPGKRETAIRNCNTDVTSRYECEAAYNAGCLPCSEEYASCERCKEPCSRTPGTHKMVTEYQPCLYGDWETRQSPECQEWRKRRCQIDPKNKGCPGAPETTMGEFNSKLAGQPERSGYTGRISDSLWNYLEPEPAPEPPTFARCLGEPDKDTNQCMQFLNDQCRENSTYPWC